MHEDEYVTKPKAAETTVEINYRNISFGIQHNQTTIF